MANELRVWRARRRVSQLDVAKVTGIKQYRLSLIENEVGTEVKPEERSALAAFFGVSEAELFPPSQEVGA